MSVGAIGNNEAWSEFLKLARGAQVRNPGFSEAAPTARGRETGASRGVHFAQPTAIQGARSADLSSAAAEPKRYTRILGNHFDAYA